VRASSPYFGIGFSAGIMQHPLTECIHCLDQAALLDKHLPPANSENFHKVSPGTFRFDAMCNEDHGCYLTTAKVDA